MIKKLEEKDRAMVMEFLGEEPSINLFIIGDVEAFGFAADFQELWGQFAENGEIEAVLKLGSHIRELYQGPFLPEDPYTPWIDMKREALKNAYVQALQPIAKLLADTKRTVQAADCCHAILEADPCLEAAARLLMEISARQGRPNEALRIFQALERSLEADLGLPPDHETCRLAERIRDGRQIPPLN